MSLFKVCTWWKTQCTDVEENYDSASLLCCRFGLIDNEKDFIIVGSHNGNLSIFYPETTYETLGEFKPTDLILETKFDNPVIGLLYGKFSGSQRNENTNQLGVLHLSKLSIYTLLKMDGVTDQGNSYRLQPVTEHKFKIPAFSACKGAFGKIQGRDFICITHMDGNLTFYEQDGISYNVEMPGFSLPTVIRYIPRIDSFVRVNFSWELECFSYQNLSQYNSSNNEIKPSWSICLGEFILDVTQVQVTNDKAVIMILGEHNLISVSDEGRLQFILKLDYAPKCFCSFVVGWYWEPNANLITAVISDSSTLLIYNDMKLIWASQLEQIPVAIKRSNCSLAGAIVTLSETGHLNIGYLGSEPLTFKVPPLNLQDMNFEKAHNELLELEKEIKNGIELEGIDNKMESCTFEILSDDLKDKNILMCAGGVRYKSKEDLEQLQITFLMSDKIQSSNSFTTINNVTAGTSEMINTYFYITENVNISTLKVEAFVSYINKQGIPRVLRKDAYLPLNLFYIECSPQKDAAIKLIISYVKDTRSSNHKLTGIFSNFFKRKTDVSNVQAIGLRLIHTDAVVTVVAAKNNPNRFRIQSDNLEAIPAVLEAMINYAKNLDASLITATLSDDMLMMKKDIIKAERNKIRNQYNRKDILMAPSIPYDEIIHRIENHHDIQKALRKQTLLMDALWNQFKLFQTSLQSKREDEPIDGLMMLIEKNYDDLVTEGDKLISLRNMEYGKKCNLSCAIALTNLITSNLNIEKKIIDIVTSVLSYPIEDWLDKSWEETLEHSITMLHHHHYLQYSNKSTNKITDIPTFSYNTKCSGNFEFDKFKKHFITLIERLHRLASSKNDSQLNNKSIESSVVNKQSNKITKNDSINAITNIPEDGASEEIENDKSSVEITENEEKESSSADEEIDNTANVSDWIYKGLPSTEVMMMENMSK
ncbi:protein PTHB1 [Condylostylus longicornis]|uniref:protein PTHB1 n=1 Tax=Condylostylus longicornis TaxID=2530218 RepID=UPI00244E0A47|nr:protein PTHB1 [Condylostylus longicornis]